MQTIRIIIKNIFESYVVILNQVCCSEKVIAKTGVGGFVDLSVMNWGLRQPVAVVATKLSQS